MNDSIYEEYMRSALGYQPMNNYNTYDMNFENWEIPNMTAMSNLQMRELENCYPEIYRMIYPMVQKACGQNTRPITRELIDSMTDEIYFAIEDREMVENRTKDEKIAKSTTKGVENRQTIIRNTGLNDLIRILILRELLGRPGFPGFPGERPPRQRPPRPPMRPPMGPPRPQPRPGMGPFNRNTYAEYNDLYEY